MWNFIKGGLTMYKQKLILGVAPVKRSFLSMEEAKRQKDKFMAVIRDIKPDAVEIDPCTYHPMKVHELICLLRYPVILYLILVSSLVLSPF